MFCHHSMRFLLFLAIWLLSMQVTVSGAEHPELKAFPFAEENIQRFVIVLPHKDRGIEDTFRVEILPGKIMLTDGVNLIRLGTTIEPRPLKGWGYTYYEITGKDVAMSTMMAAPETGQQIEKFVQGASLFIRYNSRLPIVVYAPQGYEIRYRIWETSEITKKSEQG
jgi:ecotin